MSDCFIIMPISTPDRSKQFYQDDNDHFLHVLNHLICPAIELAGFNPVPPAATGNELIHARIIENLENAEMVLCDMSLLNPNVFFELGVRVALNKPVCMIKDDVTEQVPFDTGILNFHTYSSSIAPWILNNEIESLSNHVRQSAPEGEQINSLWKYFGLSSHAQPMVSENGNTDKLDYLTIQIEALRRQFSQLTLKEKQSRTQKRSKNGIGKDIQKARVERGLTQSELAELVNVSPRTLDRIENGRGDVMTINKDMRIIRRVMGKLGMEGTFSL